MALGIGEWLEGLGLGKYAEVFVENGVDLRALPHLSEDDLKELGVLLGHRRILLAAIQSLQDDEHPRQAEEPAREPPSRGAAERRQLTVMFCDLVGSTELSGRLDPEDLREVMRRYQDAAAGAVTRYEGYVAKFLGDGVLAYFGWPRAHEDQAERAVRAGLDAVATVANVKLDRDVALQARAGIATGQVVVGDLVGEAAAEAQAVAGETPNLAARLQGLAAPGQVVICATTRLLIGETFDLKDLGPHELKGFAEPVAAWHVRGGSGAESRFEAAHPGALTQLVGREHELGLLRRAWEQSRSGIGQVVLVTGEPGIGKSRLVEALGAELKADGCTRITLGCSPYYTNSALYPVIKHLEQVLRWQDEDSAETKLTKLERALQDFSFGLEEVIPLLASLLSLPLEQDRYPSVNLMPGQQKQQTLDAIVAWLLEEAERQPILQVWEDLHWADPSTLELLTLEIEQAPTAPILNVLTFRPDFATPWPQRSHMTPLTLNRLERPEVEALISQQAGGKALPSRVVDHIVDRTDGVPLYVEELTKAILEADFLHEIEGSYQLTGPLSGVTIPATLQDSLMARLDRRPTIREVAQLGAVLGREFGYEMLQAITSLEEATLQEGLDRLVDAELLYQRGRPPRAKYVFKHALVQDVAYQSLLRSRRQELHSRVAQALIRQFPELGGAMPEVIAHHYTEAGQTRLAIEYWLKAADAAGRKPAFREAIAHLTKGLQLLEDVADARDKAKLEIQLRITAGVALNASRGPVDEVRETYSRARTLCEDIGDERQLYTALWGLWFFNEQRMNFEAARDFADELLRLAGRQSDEELLLQAHHAAWTTCLYRGELDRCYDHTDQGVALYNSDAHHRHSFIYAGHDAGVCAKYTAGLAICLLGRPDSGIQKAEESLALAEQLTHPFSLALALTVSALIRQFRGEVAATLALAERLRTVSEEHGIAVFRATSDVLRGWSTAASGNPDSGIVRIRRGLDTLREMGAGLRRSYFLWLLCEAYAEALQYDEALEALADASEFARKSGERWWEAEIQRRRGELIRLRPRRDAPDPEEYLRSAFEIANQQGAKLLSLRAATSLARGWCDRGMQTDARDLLAPIYRDFTEGLNTADLKEARALLDNLA